jgi:hypothetical protein
MNVEYRELDEYPGYMFGSDGSVWSRQRRGPNPRKLLGTKWRKMKLTFSGARPNNRYFNLSLRRADGTVVNRLVHVLILEAFVGPRPEGMVGRHFPDPDTRNCAITNLRWGTHQQNCDDRERAGNTLRGSANKNSKLTEDVVHEIRAATGRGCVAAMCRKHGISRTTVHYIRSRRTWTHV